MSNCNRRAKCRVILSTLGRPRLKGVHWSLRRGSQSFDGVFMVRSWAGIDLQKKAGCPSLSFSVIPESRVTCLFALALALFFHLGRTLGLARSACLEKAIKTVLSSKPRPTTSEMAGPPGVPIDKGPRCFLTSLFLVCKCSFS